MTIKSSGYWCIKAINSVIELSMVVILSLI
jgi:hypothetical protein